MLLNWIKKNAYKLTDVEGANFHILTPKYESQLLERLGTTEAEFEDKVLNSPDKVMNVKIFDDLDSSEIIQSRKHTILPLDASPAKKIIASTQKIDTKILRNAMKESEKKNLKKLDFFVENMF